MNLSLDQLKDIPAQIQAFKVYYSRLSERERYIVIGMIGGGAFVLLFLIYTTFWGLSVRMASKIEKGRQNITRVQELQTRYQKSERQVKQMEAMIQRTPPNFQLLSHLEKLSQKNSVKIENAREMAGGTSNDLYKETQVSLSMSKISLRTLINLLYDIENGEQLMRISTLKVKPDYTDPSQLNVNFVVSTFQAVR